MIFPNIIGIGESESVKSRGVFFLRLFVELLFNSGSIIRLEFELVNNYLGSFYIFVQFLQKGVQFYGFLGQT